MEATYKINKNELTIKFIGQITGTEGAHFTEECEKILGLHYSKIFLDMSYVPSMNSSAIGDLIRLHKSLISEQRSLVISGIHENLNQAFFSIHLDKILNIHKLA
ncbi:MAG: anti-sigma factor antagonist [Calditrichaeota bacterium]|nr:MAG: anti-sigma factor antagonist [Calditrichota bacterium]